MAVTYSRTSLLSCLFAFSCAFNIIFVLSMFIVRPTFSFYSSTDFISMNRVLILKVDIYQSVIVLFFIKLFCSWLVYIRTRVLGVSCEFLPSPNSAKLSIKVRDLYLPGDKYRLLNLTYHAG